MIEWVRKMEQITTVILADRVKSLIGRDSYYAVAKALNVNQETVACWYKRGTVMDDSTAVRVAELLELDPHEVVAWLRYEAVTKRGDDKVSQLWRDIAERIPA